MKTAGKWTSTASKADHVENSRMVDVDRENCRMVDVDHIIFVDNW